MHRFRTVTLWLLAAVALATVATVHAQKKGGTPSWTVTLPSDDSASIFGPVGYTYANGTDGVLTTVSEDSRKNLAVLNLEIRNPPAATWIGFRDFVRSGDNTPYPYPQPQPLYCHYPPFENGILLPGGQWPFSQDCIVQFLSGAPTELAGHRHPQLPYGYLQLQLQMLNLLITPMAVGQSVTVNQAMLGVYVGLPRPPPTLYSGIGLNLEWGPGTVTVTRLTQDQWRMVVNVGVGLWETVQTTNTDRKGNVTYGLTLTQLSRTLPVHTTMVWTRVLQ
jgi:hypothetical protein